MRRVLGVLLLACLSAGCASRQLKKEAHWEKTKAQAALIEDAKAGKYHASMDRMMEVANYMFDTEGFLFVRRDDDAKTFVSAPWKINGVGDPHIVELDFNQDGTVVTATWKHLVILNYKNEDACKGDAACQKDFNDDWNWRLFQHLP